MLRVSLAYVFLLAFSVSSLPVVAMWANKGKGLHRQRYHQVVTKSPRKRLYLRVLKKSDPVRKLRRAIMLNKSCDIASFTTCAGFIFPCGSNAISMLTNWQSPITHKTHAMLIEHGASYKLPNLITFENTEPIDAVGDDDRAYSQEREQREHFHDALYPILVASRALLSKSEEDTLQEFKAIYRVVAQQAGSKAARAEMIKFIHNGVAFSNSLLIPFYFSPALNPEHILTIKQRFQVHDYRSVPAHLLARLGVVKAKKSEAELIESTQRFVLLLAPDYIVNVARIIAGLMLDPEVKFLADQPERAYLLLPRNFSDRPLYKLPIPEAHAQALRVIRKTVKKIQSLDS